MKESVSLLRKNGQLIQAYQLADKQLTNSPEDKNCKNDMLWVYYAFIKEQLEQINYSNILKIMKKVCELGVFDNQMFNDSFNWQLVKLIGKINTDDNNQKQLLDILKTCHNMLQNQEASESKSILIKMIMKQLKGQPQAWQLLNFLDFSHYRKEDFNSEEYQGKKMMPLFEQMLYAFLKNWLLTAKEKNQEALDYAPVIIQQLNHISQHYSFKFLNYYFAQLYLLIDNKSEAYIKAKLFLQKNLSQAWAWELLAKSTESSEEKIQFLSKALVLQNKKNFTVGILQSIIDHYIFNGESASASYFAQQLIAIRKKEGWNISNSLYQIALANNTNKDIETQLKESIQNNAKNAMQSAFNQASKQTMVISGVDKNRALYFLVSQEGNTYKLKNKKRYHIGQLVLCLVLNDTIVDMQIQKQKTMSTAFIKTITAKLKCVKDFGFLGNAFVSPKVVKSIKNKEDELTALAIKEKNPKTQKLAWRVLHIYSNNC